MFIAQAPSWVIRTGEGPFLLESVSDPVCALRMGCCLSLPCSWPCLYLPRAVVYPLMPCMGVASSWGSIQVVSGIADTAGCSFLPKPRVWPVNFPFQWTGKGSIIPGCEWSIHFLIQQRGMHWNISPHPFCEHIQILSIIIVFSHWIFPDRFSNSKCSSPWCLEKENLP